MTNPTNADVYKESLQSARHLSALRFVILTVFITATGAIVSAYFSKESELPLAWILFGGLWLSVVFFVIEVVLSFTMARHSTIARVKAGDSHADAFSYRSTLALWSIRIAIPSIYVFVAIFWGYLFLHKG